MKSNNFAKLAGLIVTMASVMFSSEGMPVHASVDVKPAPEIHARKPKTNSPIGTDALTREFEGLVVSPTGKPMPNAEVVGSEVNASPMLTHTDIRGDFSMTLRPGDIILARSGSLGAEAVTYKGEKRLVIRLKAGKLCTIKGRVTNDDGTPITDATIRLFLKGPGNDIGFMTGHTDPKGNYSLAPTYQGATYYVQADSPTHDQLKTSNFFIYPAQTIHTMPLTLSFADSFAGGVILDPQGNPYFGAVLSRDGNNYGPTFKTDESGRFMMKNLPRKRAHVFVQTGIGNYTQVDLKCGISDNVVRLPEKAMPK